jgi:chaperonin GroEL
MYSPKQISFERNKLKAGIKKIADAVISTLGPGGRPVIIESSDHLSGITVTKDGVTVAKAISLLDAEENIAVRIMREASERTAGEAGDGTTTAIVDQNIDFTQHNRVAFVRQLEKDFEEVERLLLASSTKLGARRMRDVATISANGDSVIGDIIYKAYRAVGKGGLVTVENSDTEETYFEVTNGLRYDVGYSSNLFVNNQKRDECIFEDVHIFICDSEVSNILQIEAMLKGVIQSGKKLLFVSPLKSQVLNTLAANVVKNGMQFCAIEPPHIGWKRHEALSDLALLTGGKYFSDKSGDNLNLATVDDLGFAKKVIVGRDNTVIVVDEQKTPQEAIQSRVEELKDALRTRATRKAEKDFLRARIASLSGGVSVIYVGGNTDLEQKERFDRVDDAVWAVRSAQEEGIVPGGGAALWHIAQTLDTKTQSMQCLAYAMRAPLRAIVENVGGAPDVIESMLRDAGLEGLGYDGTTGELRDMMEAGIIDPAKVTRSALRSAISVATTILSANAIITAARDIV